MDVPSNPNVPSPLGREERKRLQALFEEQKGEPIENPPDEGVPGKGLGAFVEFMKKELGGDTELVKQTVADLHALERQDARNKGPSTAARAEAFNDVPARATVVQVGFITERRPRMRIAAEIAFRIIAVVVAAVSAYWVTTRPLD